MRTPAREWSTRSRAGRGEALLAPTARQVEVWLAVLRHGGTKNAAASFDPPLSPNTVANHLATLMARMEARDGTHLVELMWERYPNLRTLMNFPSSRGLGQRHERRSSQRRKDA